MPAGRSISDKINHLLTLPWRVRVATQDWHPQDHVSFASNHPAPNNQLLQRLTVHNPVDEDETAIITLWPDHCVQNTFGAQLAQELDIKSIDHMVKKGQDSRVEMFSAFQDNFLHPCVRSDLLSILQARDVSRVYVVGLATDYCVKDTALHASQYGLDTTVLKDASKAIDDSSEALGALDDLFKHSNIKFLEIAEAGLG